MPRADAVLDHAVLPVAAQDFGSRPRGGHVGIGAQVADPGVEVQLAFGCEHHQAVVTAAARGVVRLPDAHAVGLRALSIAAALAACRPVELLGALVEGFGHVGAGERPLLGADGAGGVGGVDPADGQAVESQFARGLVDDRFHRGRDLVLPRSALGAPRGGIGGYADAAIAHRLRLVDDRHGASRGVGVGETAARAGVLHQVQVCGGDAAVVPEAEPDPSLKSAPCRAEKVFLVAADAQHDRAADLLRKQRRDADGDRAAGLGTEPAAAVLVDQHDILDADAALPGDSAQRRGVALAAGVHVALAVLPVGHGGSRFHGMVRVALGDEGLVQDQAGFGEARLQIAEGPLLGRFAHG